MIYYLTPIITGFTLSFYKFSIGNLKLNSFSTINLFVFVSAIIFCGGYMTGSDWIGYELLYDEASITNLKFYSKEKGFYLLMLIFKTIGLGFFPFLIICKFFVFYVLKNFILKHFKSFYLPFAIFLASDALFLFVDNPLRFMIAFGFVIISLKYLLDRKFIVYSFIIIIATTFHISSIIMLILYFTPNIKMLRKFYVLLLYFFFFFLLDPEIIRGLIEKQLPYLVYLVEWHLEKTSTHQFHQFPIGKIVKGVFFIIIVMNREKIQNYHKYGKLFYALTISYFYILLICSTIPTFFRFSYFFVPFLYLSLSILLLSPNKIQKLIRIFIISYFLLSPIQKMYSTWVYLPYTNYFTSLLKEKKEYNFRANYNKNMYFKRTGSYPE